MAIAIDPLETFDYILAADRPTPRLGLELALDPTGPETEPPTVWKLGPLSFRQRALLEDMAVGMDPAVGIVSGRMGSQNKEVLRAGLRGVVDFRDASGEPVAFHQNGRCNVLGQDCEPPSWAFLDRLHPDDSTELATAIRDVQRVTVDEGKG